MTTREKTSLLSLAGSQFTRSLPERALVFAWGALQWPWLLRSLWGGHRSEKLALMHRLGLPEDALPNLGSWKADTVFLHRIVEVIERTRPQLVVELGCGATSLVIARALALNGGGRLLGFDQHAHFVEQTSQWLESHGADAELRPAPIVPDHSRWSSLWYDLPLMPHGIDLLVIDGPPWALNPFIRGRAEILFDLLSPGGVVLLDDAARPGERVVAHNWRKRWPDMTFDYLSGGKGTLVGQRNDADFER